MSGHSWMCIRDSGGSDYLVDDESAAESASVCFLQRLLPSSPYLPSSPGKFWRALQARMRKQDTFLLRILQSRQGRQHALLGRVLGAYSEAERYKAYGEDGTRQLFCPWAEFQRLLNLNGHFCAVSAVRKARAQVKGRQLKASLPK